LNHTSYVPRHISVSVQFLTGSNPDISLILFFLLNKTVYNLSDYIVYPSSSFKERGCWIVISEHVGHAMTFIVFTDSNSQVIHCSNICTACDPTSVNLRLDPLTITETAVILSRVYRLPYHPALYQGVL
jgi:hypothetical protein